MIIVVRLLFANLEYFSSYMGMRIFFFALLIIGCRSAPTKPQDRLSCAGQRCGTVSRHGVLIPEYCGLEGRCEACSASACNFRAIPPPCRAFCSHKPTPAVLNQAHNENHSSSRPIQPSRAESAPDKDAKPLECDHHSSLLVTVLCFALLCSLVVNIVQFQGVGMISLCFNRGRQIDLNPNELREGLEVNGNESSDQKVPLVRTIAGSQVSVASQRSSDSECLRHIRTHPEDETNAYLAQQPA